MFTDYNSYKEGIKLAFEGLQRFTEMKATALFVYVLAIDAAVCTTEFKGKYLSTDGDTVVWNGCWTFVFKKFNGEWKVIHENGTHTQDQLYNEAIVTQKSYIKYIAMKKFFKLIIISLILSAGCETSKQEDT